MKTDTLFVLLVLWIYARMPLRLQASLRSIVARAEGGEIYSPTLRAILRSFHGIDIGMYSHGGCLDPAVTDRFTTIGRYCSVARTARMITRLGPDGPLAPDVQSLDSDGVLEDEGGARYSPLSVGSDVHIGSYATVLPSVRGIGHGAVIAARAVVTQCVPDYAVVVGNPARVVRYRFTRDVIRHLLDSEWWKMSIDEIDLEEFTRPYVSV